MYWYSKLKTLDIFGSIKVWVNKFSEFRTFINKKDLKILRKLASRKIKTPATEYFFKNCKIRHIIHDCGKKSVDVVYDIFCNSLTILYINDSYRFFR